MIRARSGNVVDPASGQMEEKVITGSVTTWHDYILADGKYVAERFNTTGAIQVNYFILDHLGSITTIVSSIGGVMQRLSYDSWGQRRNADGSAAACGAIASSTTRGFTGQEMMDGVCWINFNARLYDPSLGRFMSADPVIGNPTMPQELNRYSYVLNNPLSLTDPSGLCAFGCFWDNGIFRAIRAGLGNLNKAISGFSA